MTGGSKFVEGPILCLLWGTKIPLNSLKIVEVYERLLLQFQKGESGPYCIAGQRKTFSGRNLFPPKVTLPRPPGLEPESQIGASLQSLLLLASIITYRGHPDSTAGHGCQANEVSTFVTLARRQHYILSSRYLPC